MTTLNTKRTRTINLTRMRKAFSPKPISIGVTAVLLSACGNDYEDASVFTNVADCINQMPEHAEQCQVAYQNALNEAARTAPKYRSQAECEVDFGIQQCTSYQGGGNNWFMPFMAGYMVSSLMRPNYHSAPMFTSYSRYSPHRYQWMGSDGRVYGDFRSRHMKVNKKAFTPKPTVNRTIKRGGFGSSVRAKSSWGSSRGGWGG